MKYISNFQIIQLNTLTLANGGPKEACDSQMVHPKRLSILRLLPSRQWLS